MKTSDFNKIYNQAQEVKIVKDEFFNCSGWFWINLTEKQHKKMYALLIKQGAKEITNAIGRKQIQLENGLGILKL